MSGCISVPFLHRTKTWWVEPKVSTRDLWVCCLVCTHPQQQKQCLVSLSWSSPHISEFYCSHWWYLRLYLGTHSTFLKFSRRLNQLSNKAVKCVSTWFLHPRTGVLVPIEGKIFHKWTLTRHTSDISHEHIAPVLISCIYPQDAGLSRTPPAS